MTHDLPPGAWRCAKCGMLVGRTASEPVCHPDDGAALIASLADPFFGPTDAESYTRPSDTEAWDEG